MHITVLSTGQGLSSLVAAPFELFKYTGVLWNDLLGKKQQASFEVVTASQDGKPQLFDSNIIVKPDQKACSIEETDLVYMPGMGVEIDKMIANNPDVIKLIKNQAEKGTIVAGVCSGVAMLAEAGILDGKEATTHWALAKQFKQRFPAVNWQTDQFITQSGNIFCGGGVYGALDLCLRLIEYFAGYKIAKQSAQAFLIDSPRTWQSSYSSSLLKQTHHDEKIKQAQEYLFEHFTEHYILEKVCQKIGMSQRNFNRRFKKATDLTPLAYLHQLRINFAKVLLESDFKSIQQIGYEVGYEDNDFFRNIFKRYTRLTPTEYRMRFAKKHFEENKSKKININ